MRCWDEIWKWVVIDDGTLPTIYLSTYLSIYVFYYVGVLQAGRKANDIDGYRMKIFNYISNNKKGNPFHNEMKKLFLTFPSTIQFPSCFQFFYSLLIVSVGAAFISLFGGALFPFSSGTEYCCSKHTHTRYHILSSAHQGFLTPPPINPREEKAEEGNRHLDSSSCLSFL